MSASKALFGADPAATMVIRKVTENITTFSMPFARYNQAKIGGRGTVGMHVIHSHAQFGPWIDGEYSATSLW